MTFILRIYLIGLVAFVPSDDGRHMAVLLVDARDGYHASDGSFFPPHSPVLLARAGSCKGACLEDAEKAAPHLFAGGPDVESSALVQRLKAMLLGGGVWQIAQEDLAVLPPPHRDAPPRGLVVVGWQRLASPAANAKTLPADATEKAAFSWVPEIAKVVPDAGEVDPDCLAPQPRKGLIAGRLSLSEGTLRTYRLAEFFPQQGRGGVPSFLFRPLAAGTPGSTRGVGGSPQGIADWTVVDIPIEGCEVTLSAKPFGGAAARTMTLAPTACTPGQVVELALVNLPDQSARQAPQAAEHQYGPEGIASHFEVYYELADHRPAWRQRLVPVVTGTYLDPALLDQTSEPSQLLRALGLSRGGTFSRPICTQAVFRPSAGVVR
jgi:hypothetical protein